jgi:oligopeptide transport system permease protein
MRKFFRNRLAGVSLGLLAIVVLSSLILPLASPHREEKAELEHAFRSPGSTFHFGSDATGRDLMVRVFRGVRLTFAVGLVAVLISLSIGVVYGALAGYFGKRVDAVMMRTVDILYGLPTIAFVMLMIAVFRMHGDRIFVEASGLFAKENRYLWDLFITTAALGLISWLTIARIVRAQVLALKEMEFVEAARAMGAGDLWILFRHIVPNLMGPVIVYVTLTLPSIMLFESFLSFLGLGIKEPNVSLGLLLDDGVKRIAATNIQWWLIVFPGAVLALVLFCLNAIGDALRDALDVK